jgi:hypothetical protein
MPVKTKKEIYKRMHQIHDELGMAKANPAVKNGHKIVVHFDEGNPTEADELLAVIQEWVDTNHTTKTNALKAERSALEVELKALL